MQYQPEQMYSQEERENTINSLLEDYADYLSELDNVELRAIVESGSFIVKEEFAL